jgi:hypothetical protein
MIPYAEEFLSPKLDIILENTLINVIEIASSHTKNIYRILTYQIVTVVTFVIYPY